MEKIVKRNPKCYKKGEGLRSLKSFKVRDKSPDQIMRAMRDAGLSARRIAKGVDILEKGILDKDCKMVLTLSGITTISKMGGIICEMIDDGWIDCIVATGALIAHGIVEGAGGVHFEYDPSISDEELYEMGYDRIYDTLELESNLDDTALQLEEVWKPLIDSGKGIASSDFCREVGRMLNDKYPHQDSIMKSAFLKNVPVFIPAFTDSELALDLVSYFAKRGLDKGMTFDEAIEDIHNLRFNPFIDLKRYFDFTREAEKMGILTLGGGVPRNYAQQVMPMLDILGQRLSEYNIADQLEIKKFMYGVRICPEPVSLGGLSGCTYSEGISWGKFASTEEGGEFAEIHSDYTAVLPWMVKSLQERLKK